MKNTRKTGEATGGWMDGRRIWKGEEEQKRTEADTHSICITLKFE